MNEEKLTEMPRVNVRQPFENDRWNAFANVWNGNRAAHVNLVDDDGDPLIVNDPTAKTVGLGGSTTASGDGLATTNVDLSGTQRHTGAAILTPPQIVAATNNYNPTGLDAARALRLSTDASRNLTGLAAQPAGTVLTIINTGANAIVLKHESGSSTAANRFALSGGVDITLAAHDAIQVFYDDVSARWRRFG